MRAWVVYRTFRTPDRHVRFYTVRNELGANLLGSDSNFNLVISRAIFFYLQKTYIFDFILVKI